MKQPFALLKTEQGWKPFQTKESVRGHEAELVILFSKPRKDARELVEACVSNQPPLMNCNQEMPRVCVMEDLLFWAHGYLTLGKAFGGGSK